MSAMTQRQTRESGQDKLQAALKALEQGVEAITDSGEFRRYLTMMARLHQYSSSNAMLIMTQRPDATTVAGYRRWQQLGRQVRKGEKGLVILAPVVRKADDEGDDTTKVVAGFRITTVFDVSQTDGDDLPEPPTAEAIKSATDKGGELVHRLEAWLSTQDVLVEVGECGNAHGYYQPGARRIVLSPGIMGTDHQAKTLCHEAAHYVAGHRGYMSRGDCETIAEASAFCVLSHFGLDTSSYSFGYVAGWAQDGDVLKHNLEAIRRTAHDIIAALETSDQDNDCASACPERAVEAS
jgi:antirestriction protein ArdC